MRTRDNAKLLVCAASLFTGILFLAGCGGYGGPPPDIQGSLDEGNTSLSSAIDSFDAADPEVRQSPIPDPVCATHFLGAPPCESFLRLLLGWFTERLQSWDYRGQGKEIDGAGQQEQPGKPYRHSENHCQD